MEEIIERPNLNSFELDGIISRVAGEICTLLDNQLGGFGDCFFLIPAISVEVSKPLRNANEKEISLWDQKEDIAWDIKAGVHRVLLSYDIDSAFVEKLAREVGRYVLSSIEEAFKEEPKLANVN